MKVRGEIDIDVSGGLQEGMLARWDGKTWEASTKRSALSDIYADLKSKDEEITSLKSEIETLKTHINTLAKAIGGNDE